MDISEEA